MKGLLEEDKEQKVQFRRGEKESWEQGEYLVQWDSKKAE